MIISLSPVLLVLTVQSFVDFTVNTLPEFLYTEQPYHLETNEPSNTTQSPTSTTPTLKREALTDDQLRKQLCPNIPEEINYSYRYNPKTKRCDTVGDQSACGNNMILYGEMNNTVYGFCDCASIQYDRTLIYHPPTNQCYFIFEKAYCREGEWLTLSLLTGKPTCAVNPCRKKVKKKTDDEFVTINSSCVLLGSTCERNKVVQFKKNYVLPKCVSAVQFSGFAIGAMQPSCSPGSMISMTGKCQSSWQW